MTPLVKTILIGVAASFMLAGITTGTQGFVGPGSSLSVMGESRGLTQFRARLICVECSLDEVQKTQPDKRMLIELRHNQGRVVMQMTWINEGSVCSHIMVPRMLVRAQPGLFQQLMAEENMFKEVEILGVINRSRTLDMSIVAISPSAEPIGGSRFNSASSRSK